MNVLLSSKRTTITAGMALLVIGFFLARPYIAQAQGVDQETQFILNTFMFLVWGALIMWMWPGSQCWSPALSARRTPP